MSRFVSLRKIPSLVSGYPRLAISALALIAGCAHLGPKSIPMDRFDYSTAVAESWKQQTLLNIVKLRYMDLPLFVDVSSIVSGYSMETSVSGGGEFYPSDAASGYAAVGATGKFTDRPTITYTPLTGDKFLRGIFAPIDPKNIFSMIQSGYPADFVLGLTVESINGVHNRSTAGGMFREAEPAFLRALELIREVQSAGAVGVRVKRDSDKNSPATLFFRRNEMSADIAEKAAEIRRLLHMPSDRQEFTLIYSPVRESEDQLAVNSRSMMQIMGCFASYVDAPEEHIKAHWTVPAFENLPPEARVNDPVRIHSGERKPASAYAAVSYRGYWFWIDESDWRTKRALTAIMFFFTLADTGDNARLPMVTIPAQ